ncbi:pilus assembly protein TadG-related protein [Terrabacter ginsenosidimutans]
MILRQARRRRDRGAAATLFTALFAGGVIIGMLALSVDVGSIMYERRQIQNSADATAMAFAQRCATAAAYCNPSEAGTAAVFSTLLAGNSVDGLSQMSGTSAGMTNGVCGRLTGSTVIATCLSASADASVTELAKCPPLPALLRGTGATIPYVETYAKTKTAGSNPNILPKFFSQALAGGSPDTTVRGCARAAWGTPGQYTAKVPIVVSECEWIRNTSSGTVYQLPPGSPAPGYGSTPGQTAWPALSAEITILLKSTTTVPCAINGKDTAGGFGYVHPTSGCGATVSINDWAQIDTGSSPPDTSCYSILAALRGTVIELPIFDCLVKTSTMPTGPITGYSDCTGAGAGGANSYYHVKGWAKFYLTGYKIGGSQEAASLRSGSVPCTGGVRCLSGWYTTGTLSAGGTIVPPTPGSNFGAYVVAPAG